MKVIAITGTPGVGKSTLAKAVTNKLKGKILDVNTLIKQEKLYTGRDEARDCFIVDEHKLKNRLEECIHTEKQAKYLIIDSHMSHFLPSKLVDLCVVVQCDLAELQRRLQKREYYEGKVRENREAEIFETCLTEATETGHNVLTVSNSSKKELKTALRRVLESVSAL